MKYPAILTLILCLAVTGAYAGVTINGTTIIFDDASTQTKAAPADHGDPTNVVNGTNSHIGGGYYNTVTDNFGTIGGGTDNQAGDDDGNSANRQHATVAGGWGNMASGSRSTVSGGVNNVASGFGASVSGGRINEASGSHAAVGGGFGNTAGGDYSFVAGDSADDLGYANSFVWGGSTGARTSFGANTFNVWSSEIYLNGSVYNTSDRNMKESFSFVSAREVLDKVVEMPVGTWRFKTEDDSVRHIGPMAQDFMAAFGYGKSDKHIMSTDADGVALAAIQGLNEKLDDKDEEITALRWHNAQLEARLRRLESAIFRDDTD